MKTSRALAALQSLCTLGLDPEVLVPAVLEALHEVVPSYRNLFDWTDEQGRLLRYFIEGPIDAPIAQLYFDQFHNRREAEVMPRFDTLHRHPPGVRGAAALEHPAFFNSALYHEIWRPQGFHTRIEGVLRDRAGRLIGSLVLYRSPGEPRFSLHDERRLAAVLPALALGLQVARPVAAQERHVAGREPPQTLLMTLDGRLCHASAGAHRLLLMAEGGASRQALSKPLQLLAGRLLPMLLGRLREQACVDADALSLAAPASITHETAAGRFVASAVLLRALDERPAGVAEGLVQVTLRRLEPHRVAIERALRALPLTTGQLLVCRELVQGRSQAQIGQLLGVAPATVVDHVRKIYRALDLRSPLALNALVQARAGLP